MFKKLIKKATLGAIIAFSLICNATAFSMQHETVSIELNEKPLAFDVPAMIINDRTMVPMRGIFEALNYDVAWDNTNKTILAKGSHTVNMQIGSHEITVDNKTSKIDTPPLIIDSRTLIPLRALGESIGCTVAWDNASRTVNITYNQNNTSHYPTSLSDELSKIPEFSNTPYVTINNNIPYFTLSNFSERSFESYSELDSLGRCGQAFANIGYDLMPTEKRGSIGQIKPSGWHTVKYDFIDGKYLYNRCHLIGFQLTAENDNEKNLITGTRYMNTTGMLPFENMVANYIKANPNKHVLYRVTPIYKGNNLLASGLVMEALSTEDSGRSICFNVYLYNSQPNIEIDYATGISQLANLKAETQKPEAKEVTYILNKNSYKIHYPNCSSVKSIKTQNKVLFYGTLKEALNMGYSSCGYCKP